MVATVHPEQLRNSPEAFGKLLDVRSAAEFAAGHIPGAVNVPMEQIESRHADIGDGTVLVICEALAARAGIVAGWLARRQAVAVLGGGTAAWRKLNFPLVPEGRLAKVWNARCVHSRTDRAP